MTEFMRSWPSWLGSPSQFALLIIVILALIKVWPIIQKQLMDARAGREGRYSKRIRELEDNLERCHRECGERIDKLQTKINNEAMQRVQSEISLVSTIIQVVDAPQLKAILAALEKRKGLLLLDVEQISGPFGDIEGDDSGQA
jgi:hypothetical protein